MAEDLNLKVKVDTSDADASVGSLKKQLREAQADVTALSDKFGATSKEAINAAKKAADLRDRIGDAKSLTDAFNPDAKFKALTASLSGVAGGFGAVQGAMALFGAESDNVQKTLLKVQSAMAISQGLQSVGESIDSFKQLGAVIKTTAVDAFKALKVAIGSTGIGLLVIALGTLVAYWDDIKAAVSGVSDEQKKLNEETSKNLKAEEDKLDAIDGQSNQLKLQGKTEKEILDLKINQTNQAIKAAEVNLLNAKATKDAQVAASKRNKDILQGILTFLTAPLVALLTMIDKVGEAVNKKFGLAEGFTGGLAKLVFDPEEVAKEGDDSIKEAEKTLNQLKEKRAGYQLAVQGIDKSAAQARTKQLEDEAAEFQKQQNLLLQIELDAFEKRQEQRKKLGLNNIDYVGADGMTDAERKKKKEDDVKAQEIIDAREQEVQERMAKSGLGKILGIRAEHLLATIQQEEDAAAAKKRIAQLEIESKQATAYAIADITAGLSSLIGQNTAEGKAIAIASATIDTYLSASSIFKQAAKNPITVVNPAYPYLMAAPAVLAGIARVKQIASVQIPKGGGASGGMGMPSMSSAAPMTPSAPTAQTTNISQQSINEMGNQAVRAYVIESDVSSNQQRIEAIRQRARFS
jgi:hypothetical protein